MMIMKWIRKNYKLTLAILTVLTAFFTWSSNNRGLLGSPSAVQVKLEAKITETDKKVELNRSRLQDLQVKQAKDSAEIKAGLKAVKKELEEQREDTRQVLRLLMEMNNKR